MKIVKKFKLFFSVDILLFIIIWPFFNFMFFSQTIDIIDANVAGTSDFVASLDSTLATVEEGELCFLSGDGAKVFYIDVPLDEGDAFKVSMTVDCAEDFEGAEIHVDLHNGLEYDSADNEFVTTLKKGNNTIADILNYGTNHPDRCRLRIFAVDNIQASITDVVIQRGIQTDNFTRIVIISALLATVISGIAIFAGIDIPRRGNENKYRLDYIDVFRGIGILLMVMGHIGFGTKFDIWIHAFHMPMFFVISGLFAPNTQKIAPKSYVYKKVKSLLVPYFSFGLFHTLVCIKSGVDTKQIKNLFWQNTEGLPIAGALWFLTALFFADILFYCIDRYVKKQYSRALLIIAISLIGNYEKLIFPWKLPFALGAAFSGLGLYYAGYLLKKFKEDRFIETIMNLPFFLCVLFCCAFNSLIQKNGLINMRTGKYECIPLYLIVAVGCTLLGINMSKYLCKYFPTIKKLFMYIGQNSIIFVCLNQLAIVEINEILSFFNVKGLVAKILLLCFTILYLVDATLFIMNSRLSIFAGKDFRLKLKNEI